MNAIPSDLGTDLAGGRCLPKRRDVAITTAPVDEPRSKRDLFAGTRSAMMAFRGVLVARTTQGRVGVSPWHVSHLRTLHHLLWVGRSASADAIRRRLVASSQRLGRVAPMDRSSHSPRTIPTSVSVPPRSVTRDTDLERSHPAHPLVPGVWPSWRKGVRVA